ncbi:hypothetical protein ACFQY9_30930 [Microvirga aerilata]|uniref:hypothetical protein n=1 Tax=Microvirga aerilata TaxID=670292 RepID=UPI003636E8E2
MKLAHTPEIRTHLPDGAGDQARHPNRDDKSDGEEYETYNQGISGRLLDRTIDLFGGNHHGKKPRPSISWIKHAPVHNDGCIADQVTKGAGEGCGTALTPG